jgi:NAD(P)-dependent dehydrogenase (short-subunit alcohol dehydrogenase family)
MWTNEHRGHYERSKLRYSATKAAIRSFARTWTVELKARRIRVNVLSPGPILTPLVRQPSDWHIELSL